MVDQIIDKTEEVVEKVDGSIAWGHGIHKEREKRKLVRGTGI